MEIPQTTIHIKFKEGGFKMSFVSLSYIPYAHDPNILDTLHSKKRAPYALNKRQTPSATQFVASLGEAPANSNYPFSGVTASSILTITAMYPQVFFHP